MFSCSIKGGRNSRSIFSCRGRGGEGRGGEGRGGEGRGGEERRGRERGEGRGEREERGGEERRGRERGEGRGEREERGGEERRGRERGEGRGEREERGGEGREGGAGDDVRETSVSSHCESWTIACTMTNHFLVPDKVSPALLHPLEEDVEDPKEVGREEDEDRCEMW